MVFAIIGALELFDRTSFALIAIASREKPLPTFLGGAVAFVATTVISVTVGAALVDVLGPEHIGWLRVAGGVLLIGYAVWVYLQPVEEEAKERGAGHSAFVLTLATILLLELGDTTMIFEIVFVAEWGWLAVLVAGSAALVVVAAWNTTLGSRLGTRVRPATLKKVVVAVMLVVGAVTIAYGLVPGVFPALGAVAPA